LFHIDHHVAVRSGRSSGKGFQEKLRSPGIHLVYGEYQTLYGTVEGIKFQQGLPDLDNSDPREKHFIILDDLMDETDQRVASLDVTSFL
jgi:hypothetical protein